MHRHIRNTFAVLIVAAAGGLAACDGADRVTAAADEPGAHFSRGAAAGALSPAHVEGGRFGGGSSEGLVTARGGVLHLDVSVATAAGARAGRHTLYVPAHAVRGAARFTMAAGDADVAHVLLSATSLSPRAALNDVGSAGFGVPLTLCLDGTDALGGADLNVAWLKDDGMSVPLERVADPEATLHPHRVCGEVDHFSGYIIAAN
jgi:hypothetical protein